jgi:hypothetical protein
LGKLCCRISAKKRFCFTQITRPCKSTGAYLYFFFFAIPKKRRKNGASIPGERITTIFIKNSAEDYFSRKNPAVKSAAASTKASARPGNRKERKIPAPNERASAPTVLHNFFELRIVASRNKISTATLYAARAPS